MGTHSRPKLHSLSGSQPFSLRIWAGVPILCGSVEDNSGSGRIFRDLAHHHLYPMIAAVAYDDPLHALL